MAIDGVRLAARADGPAGARWTVNLVRVECLHEWIEEVWAKYFAGKGNASRMLL